MPTGGADIGWALVIVAVVASLAVIVLFIQNRPKPAASAKSEAERIEIPGMQFGAYVFVLPTGERILVVPSSGIAVLPPLQHKAAP